MIDIGAVRSCKNIFNNVGSSKGGNDRSLGENLGKGGELSMRCRWENRIFSMVDKEGLKARTNGKPF